MMWHRRSKATADHWFISVFNFENKRSSNVPHSTVAIQVFGLRIEYRTGFCDLVQAEVLSMSLEDIRLAWKN